MPSAAALKGLFAGGAGVAAKTKALIAAKTMIAAGAGAVGVHTYKTTTDNLHEMQGRLQVLQQTLELTNQKQKNEKYMQILSIAGGVALLAGGALYVYKHEFNVDSMVQTTKDSWANLRGLIDEGIKRMYGLSGPRSKPGRLSQRKQPPHPPLQQQPYIIASAGSVTAGTDGWPVATVSVIH